MDECAEVYSLSGVGNDADQSSIAGLGTHLVNELEWRMHYRILWANTEPRAKTRLHFSTQRGANY